MSQGSKSIFIQIANHSFKKIKELELKKVSFLKICKFAVNYSQSKDLVDCYTKKLLELVKNKGIKSYAIKFVFEPLKGIIDSLLKVDPRSAIYGHVASTSFDRNSDFSTARELFKNYSGYKFLVQGRVRRNEFTYTQVQLL